MSESEKKLLLAMALCLNHLQEFTMYQIGMSGDIRRLGDHRKSNAALLEAMQEVYGPLESAKQKEQTPTKR